MKTLTIEQVETLKNVYWEKEDETSFSFIPDVKTFTELTDYDIEVWTEDTQAAELSIKYQTTNITENGIPYFALRFIAKIHGIIWADEYFVMFKGDELGLFTPKAEEQKEESNWSDVLYNALTQVLQSKSIRDVVDYIDNNFSSLSDQIREDCVHNLDPSDIDDSLKEDIAREWIEENAADAYDSAIYGMESYDIKDKIIEYLSDNL